MVAVETGENKIQWNDDVIRTAVIKIASIFSLLIILKVKLGSFCF